MTAAAGPGKGYGPWSSEQLEAAGEAVETWPKDRPFVEMTPPMLLCLVLDGLMVGATNIDRAKALAAGATLAVQLHEATLPTPDVSAGGAS